MIQGIVNKNKALESLKNAKVNSGKGAFASKAANATAKTKTPLAGIAISSILKMNRLKPKK